MTGWDSLIIDQGFVIKQCVSEGKPSFLSSAVQFASSKNSHMSFIINPSTVRRR